MEEKFRELDALFAEGKMKDAEEKLTRWVDQARQEHDRGALLSLYNELEGLYRTTGRAERAVDISSQALALIDAMGLEGTIHHATTLLNGATANTVLGHTDRALDMYQQARSILESLGQQNSYQMAALCQNISHCYQQKGEYAQALEFLRRALALVSKFEHTQGEAASTRTSIALCLMALGQLDEAEKYLTESLDYYESGIQPGDGHYSSALAAAGEFYWRKKEPEKALDYYQRALAFNRAHFGHTHSNDIIQSNMDKIRREWGLAST